MFKGQKGPIGAGLVVFTTLFAVTLSACSVLNQTTHKPAIPSQGTPNPALHLSSPVSLPPDGQGLYESCAPIHGQECLDRLKQMAAGGFQLVINYDQLSGSAAQELAYAHQAQVLGMKIIWGMSNPDLWNRKALSTYPDLTATCNCSDDTGFIKYVVNLVKNLPATWGYYIGDEESNQHAQVKALSEVVYSTDPHHPRLYVSCGQCSGEQGGKYMAGLTPMVDTAEVLGPDWYPVGSGGDTVADTARVAAATQALAEKSGKQSTVVLQAFSWASYNSHNCDPWPSCAPWPTVDQMRQMKDLALQNSHPRLLLWYSFFDILRSDHPAAHWADRVAAGGAKLGNKRTAG